MNRLNDTQTQAENLDRLAAAAKALPLGLQTPDGPAPPDLGQLRDYRLLALLGESDTSRVFKALDAKRDRLVAVKVLSADPLPDEKARRRFERDVQAVGKLDHPHLVRMTDAGEADGIRFLVTEYVEGIDLRQLLRARGRLPAAEACEMVRQAALGLDFAHRRGLTHGNVKPSNLMLSVKGQVKLLDFGLSLMPDRPALGERTAARRVMSTIDDIAPEQALDAHQADEGSDIYSLRVTLYHLLTGSPPCAKTPEVEQRPCTATPVDHVAPRVPAGLAQVVAKMLSHDPRERYASAAEVAEALSPFALITALPPTVEFVAHEAAAPSAPAGWMPKMLDTETVKLGRVRARWPLVVGLVATVALVVAAVTVSIRGDTGTLVVEVDQSGAAIVIDGDDDRVRRAAAGKRMEIELLPGTHEMRVNKDGFVAETRGFEIARGDRTTFRVELRRETPAVPAAAARRRLIGMRGSTLWAASPVSLDHAQPHDQRSTQPEPRDTSTLRLLVDDRFTSPTSGFGEGSNDISSTAYVAGASQYQVIAKQSGIWSPGQPWRTDSDFVCEVEGRLAQPAAGGWGLTFGFQDNQTWFAAQVRHEARAGMQFAFRDPNLVPWPAVPNIETVTATNKLRVEVTGRRARIFVNDAFVGEAEDERFQRGGLGLVVRCEAPPVEARFERFRVWVDEPERTAPVLNEAPQPRGTDAMHLLLDDEFHDPKSGWDSWNATGSQTEYLDGTFRFLLKAPSNTWWAGPLRTAIGNFVCEVEGRVEGPARGSWGVAFAIRNRADWMSALVRDDARIALGRQTRLQELLPWTSAEPARPAGEFNTLRIEVAGRSVRLFFNGRFVDEVDGVDCDGAFALVVAGAEGGLDARYRRIRVWAETTIAPCDTSAMKLLLDDRFHDPKSGFDARDDEELLAGYLDDEYRILTKRNDTRWVTVALPVVDNVVRETVDDFVCELEGRVAQHDEGGWGLAFGERDGDWFGANVRGRSAALGWKSDYDEILMWHNERASAAPAEPSTLRMEVFGNRLRMFIDGVHVGDASDARYRGGKLALLAHGVGGAVDARYRRIRIWVPAAAEIKGDSRKLPRRETGRE